MHLKQNITLKCGTFDVIIETLGPSERGKIQNPDHTHINI